MVFGKLRALGSSAWNGFKRLGSGIVGNKTFQKYGMKTLGTLASTGLSALSGNPFIGSTVASLAPALAAAAVGKAKSMDRDSALRKPLMHFGKGMRLNLNAPPQSDTPKSKSKWRPPTSTLKSTGKPSSSVSSSVSPSKPSVVDNTVAIMPRADRISSRLRKRYAAAGLIV